MKTLFLKREYSSSNYHLGPLGTVGQLWGDGLRRGLLNTLELPWKGNEPFESCIPSGTYTLNIVPNDHLRFRIVGGTVCWGNVYLECTDIRRYNCDVHVANFLRDILGCVALGMSKSTRVEGIETQHCVHRSRDAMNELATWMAGEPAQLIISWE